VLELNAQLTNLDVDYFILSTNINALVSQNRNHKKKKKNHNKKLPRARNGGVNNNGGKEKHDVRLSREAMIRPTANRLIDRIRVGKRWSGNGTLVQVVMVGAADLR
jgi:hypothetical protein